MVAPMVIFAFDVLRAIGLDDDAALEADEIDNVRIDHELSLELKQWHSPIPQHGPKAPLSIGWILAHGPGAFLKQPVLIPHPPTRLRRAGPSLSRKGRGAHCAISRGL